MMPIEIEILLAAARSAGHAHQVLCFGSVSDWLVRSGRDYGVDLDGMTHTADTSAVRHVLKRHGDEAAERAIGQLPIHDEQFRDIPTVLLSPDKVVFGLRNDRDQDQLALVKRLDDGTTLYIEEVRLGRRTLALASMRRFPGAIADDFLRKSLDPHARSAPRGELNIVDVPPGGKALDPLVTPRSAR